MKKTDDITAADWEDIKRRRAAGESLGQIADAYGMVRSTLRERAKRAGVDMALPPAAVDARAARIAQISNPEWEGWETVRQMREDGAGWATVSREIGVCTSTLRGIMQRLGIRNAAGKRRNSNGGGQRPYAQTLCWSCANAVPDKQGKRGCAWSRHFKPVDGWDAEETQLYNNENGKYAVQSFCVHKCPEFVEG